MRVGNNVHTSTWWADLSPTAMQPSITVNCLSPKFLDDRRLLHVCTMPDLSVQISLDMTDRRKGLTKVRRESTTYFGADEEVLLQCGPVAISRLVLNHHWIVTCGAVARTFAHSMTSPSTREVKGHESLQRKIQETSRVLRQAASQDWFHLGQ